MGAPDPVDRLHRLGAVRVSPPPSIFREAPDRRPRPAGDGEVLDTCRGSENARKAFGLDQPLWVQYGRFAKGLLPLPGLFLSEDVYYSYGNFIPVREEIRPPAAGHGRARGGRGRLCSDRHPGGDRRGRSAQVLAESASMLLAIGVSPSRCSGSASCCFTSSGSGWGGRRPAGWTSASGCGARSWAAGSSCRGSRWRWATPRSTRAWSAAT